MKRNFFAAALSVALFSMPAIAQQGPAGVPGVFGLAESVTAPPPAPPAAPPPAQAKAAKRGAQDCSKSKDPGQCKARQEARAKAVEACKDTPASGRRHCLNEQKQPIDCRKASEPARCEQHQKARALCQDKLGQEHRQCLRDNLAAKK